MTKIDVETLGMDITIEGDHLEDQKLADAIENTGAVVHSIDELVAGSRHVEYIPRNW